MYNEPKKRGSSMKSRALLKRSLGNITRVFNVRIRYVLTVT